MNGSIAGAWLASAIIVGAAIGGLALLDTSGQTTNGPILAVQDQIDEHNELREFHLESIDGSTDSDIRRVTQPSF